jgi:hypothetical protein
MRIEVRCSAATDGYTCEVEVGDTASPTRHTVAVRRGDIDRWAQGRSVDQLVRRSFEFLLEREPRESILRRFDLSVIQRYFPEFDRVIQHPGPGDPPP